MDEYIPLPPINQALIDSLFVDLQTYMRMWDEDVKLSPGGRKMVVEGYLETQRKIAQASGHTFDEVEMTKHMMRQLPGSEKYLPGSGIMGTVRDKLGPAARVAGQATAILRGGIAAGMSLPGLAAALVGLGIGKVVAENMAADALKAQNPATLRVRPGSANEPAYLLLQDTAMGLLPASVTNTLPGVPAGFDSRKPPEGLPIDTSGLLAPAAVPAAAAKPEPPPEVPPPPSDNRLSTNNLPAGVPAAVPGKKIRNVSYTGIPGSDMPLIKLNYEDGSSRAVSPSDPEFRAYEDALPNRGPGLVDSVTSALSGFGSAVAGAFTPSTVVVGPDGKVQTPAPQPDGRIVPSAISTRPAFEEERDPSFQGINLIQDQQVEYPKRAQARFFSNLDDMFNQGITALQRSGRGANANEHNTKKTAAQLTYDAADTSLQAAIQNQRLAFYAIPKEPGPGASAEEKAAWVTNGVGAVAQAQSAYYTATNTVAAAREKQTKALSDLIIIASAPGMEAASQGKLTSVDTRYMPYTQADGTQTMVPVLSAINEQGRVIPLRWDDSIGAPRTVNPDGSDGEVVEVAGVAVDAAGTVLRGAVAQATGQGPGPVPQAAPGAGPSRPPAPGAGPPRPAAPGAGGQIVVMPPATKAAPAGFAPKSNTMYRENGFIVTVSDSGQVVATVEDPAYDPNSKYKPNFVKDEDGSIYDIQRDSNGAYIKITVQPADPAKLQAAEQARQNAETQRVVAANTNLGNQYTLARQAAIDTQGRNDTEFTNARADLEAQIKASTEERKRKVLDLVAQKKLTLPQALSILHDQQGLATAMSAEQQRWEQQRAQRMAEKDKGLTYAQTIDKNLNTGLAYIGASSDPKDAGFMQRYESAIAALPGRPTDSAGVKLAMQRGYSGVAYDDPGAWKQPDLTMTPEALSGMGVGEDPTDAFFAQYQALQRKATVPLPAPPVFAALPTFPPGAPVAQMPAAVGGWGGTAPGSGRFGQ